MIYNFIRVVLYIMIAVGSLFNGKLRRFMCNRLFQNYKRIRKGNYYWVHCASVGEINLSESLVRKLIESGNDKVIVTMMTDTGYNTAISKYKGNERVFVYYFPLDDVFAIRKMISNINLKKLILVETEIWPNLINEVSKKTKIVMVNGRISDKSYKSYKKLSLYLKFLFKKVDRFLMQTKEDSNRIIDLGASREKVENIGNLKFDIELEKFTNTEINKIKSEYGLKSRKIIVAGSTRNDEEEYVLKAYSELQDDYFLFLVPRHIERTQDICDRLLEGNYKYQKWTDMVASKSMKIDKDTKVVIVDAMGVLNKLYAICDVAYVGGTLVDIGGHSLLEPLYYRKTPIFGGYLQNVKEISREVIRRGIGYKIDGPKAFVNVVKTLEEEVVNTKEIDVFFNENSNTLEKAYERIIDRI